MVEFGSSGIRGPYGSEVSAELALAVGRAVGSMRRRVIVGRDARTTGPLLEAATVAGLLSAGAEPTLAGVAPTPALAYAGRAHDAALVLTASHNPAPDNGFKLWNPDGMAFGREDRREVERRIAAPPAPAAWDALAAVREDRDLVAGHAAAIVDAVGRLARPLRIVLDAGNGAGAVETPRLLTALGAEVVTLNAQPDGTFPGRPSEPSPENLGALSEAVRATGADLGLAHDGDADRCVVVDERGRVVPGDELAVVFARASGAQRVVVPVDMSMLVDDALAGVEIVRTRVGDAYVSEAIVRERAGWGGEASGAWIFPAVNGKRMTLCPDGPLAAALAASIAAREGPFGRLLADLPRYPLERASVPVPNGAKAEVVAGVAEQLRALGKVTTIDGARADTGDGWILVRASGTEPKVRVTAEARTPEAARRYLAAGVDMVQRLAFRAPS